MGRRYCDCDNYDKMYDLIELIYILRRLSNNSCVDEHSKKYLIGMLENAEALKCNFDKFREDECCERNGGCPGRYDGCYTSCRDSFFDRIIFFLKSLND